MEAVKKIQKALELRRKILAQALPDELQGFLKICETADTRMVESAKNESPYFILLSKKLESFFIRYHSNELPQEEYVILVDEALMEMSGHMSRGSTAEGK